MLSRSLPRLAVLVLAVGCATSTRARSASSAHALAAATACLDTLHAADSVSALIKMSVTPQETAVQLPADFEDLFVQDFRSRFKPPSRLPLSVVVGSPPCDSLGSRCASASLDVAVVAYATAHNDGKLDDIEVVDASLTPALAESVKTALQAMSKAATVSLSGDVESVPLVMKIGREENPDTVPPQRRVFRARVPRYGIPFRYALMPAAGVDARFPFTARLAGVGDSVALEFTVDAAGNVAMESVELVRATYRDFVSSVLNALGNTHFHPAYLGDCPVASRVTQRFFFRPPE